MRAANAVKENAIDKIGNVHKANLIMKMFIRQADVELAEQKLWMAVLCNAGGECTAAGGEFLSAAPSCDCLRLVGA